MTEVSHCCPGERQSMSPEFWIEEWRKHNHDSREEPRSACQGVEIWNRMARDFGIKRSNRVEEEDKRKVHREHIIELLEKRGALRPGVRVLDVGCGTGTWALAFAKRGAEVVGLDFSNAMAKRMREETPPELRDKITVLEADWRRIDLEEAKLAKAFDLVFANMTPAVSGPEMFLKLMEASREWCFFAGWAGRRNEPLLEGLWLHITGREKKQSASDIIIPFNLVYAMGFSPCLELHDIGWEREEAVEDAEVFFSHLLTKALGRPEEEIRPDIRDYLLGQTRDAKVTRSTTGRTGFMIWRIA